MKYFVLALQLFPAILAAVKAAEATITIPKAGADKLALITGIAEDVYAAAGDEVSKDYKKESVISIIVGIVGRVVAVLNRLGVFSQS